MIRSSLVKKINLVGLTLLMTIAPGLDMAVQRKQRPDAYDLGGYIYQAIGRTFASMQSNAMLYALAFFTLLWLARRYLFHKPAGTRAGEYLLSGFFCIMMLLSAVMRATGTLQTLYANAFQVIKVLLYCAGMFPLLLCALRGLNELLHTAVKPVKLRLWDRHPYAFPFLVLCIAWLPHIILKYPGVLMIDSCLQFREFLGITPRSTTHPAFGTLLYGLMVTLGMKIGSYNAVYFLMMLGQSLAFIAVLSYALWFMKKRRVPSWVSIAALVLFAVSPCYVGWSVVIVKDSSYLLLCMLAGALLMEFACDAKAFFKSKLRLSLLFDCLYFMILTRHNGLSIAIPLLAALLIAIPVQKLGMGLLRNFMLYSMVLVGLAVGTNEAIISALHIEKVTLYDWLSIPFQQTARVVKLHGDEMTAQEKAAINGMIDYRTIGGLYTPDNADPVKWTAPAGRTDADKNRYLAVWWQQLKRYPLEYADALLNMNYVLFDLQSNFPVYIGLSDNSLYDYVYPYSFNDMSFYESDPIRPLNSYQLALTEWYFRFSDLPVIGLFASMGFCVTMMLAMMYLAWVNRRRQALYVWIPSVIVAVSGLFCPIVYTRYLLPTICSLPLWFGAYFAVAPQAGDPETPPVAEAMLPPAGETPQGPVTQA